MSTAEQIDAGRQIAETILEQLGGARKLRLMIGAKDLLSDVRDLSFKFSAPAKNGANYCQITLDDSDTYTVRFVRVGRGPRFAIEEKGETSMVYGVDLKSFFECETGLFLSL